MYKRNIYTIEENKALTSNVFRMVLVGDTQYLTSPGQFVNIALDDRFLRRPISVYDYDAHSLTLIYKVVGGGTEQMSRLTAGAELDLLTGLGNGFDTTVATQRPLLVGGGVGIPPLYNLAKKLVAEGKQPQVVLGFNVAHEVFLYDEFRALGVDTYLATIDGSLGSKGLVTDAIAINHLQYDYYFTCGPLPMLRALFNALPVDGQLSFEERMGCGFGGCMGCSCRTITGYKRICKEGPVLLKSEILWSE